MKKLGFIFTGQGSQCEAMGKDFYETYSQAREIYEILGDELTELAFKGSLEEISQTENLQPIMVALQLSILQILKDRNIEIGGVCGLSLGEYSALVAADIITSREAMEIIKVRGKAMAEASREIPSAMAAVMAMKEDKLEEILKNTKKDNSRAYISNLNSSKQIVIAGEKSAVERSIEEISKSGGRCIPLKVSGAFHTPYMKPALKNLRDVLEGVDFQSPKIEYYLNKTGKVYKGENLVEVLCQQMISPVRLLDDIRDMVAHGIEFFLEIGPGKVITGILKKEFPQVETFNIGKVSDLKGFFKEEEKYNE